MKRTLVVTLVAVVILLLASASAAQPPLEDRLGYVDFLATGYVAPNAGTDGSFVEVAQCFSDSDNGYAVVYHVLATGGDEPSAECWLDATAQRARSIKFKFLDTVEKDESFVMYGKNNGGKWVKIFTYTDDTEVGADAVGWLERTITRVPNTKGSQQVRIRIELTNWEDLNNLDFTCGNLAFDWVGFYSTK